MSNLMRLRPHHLLCMQTYVGKGYSQKFVENYTSIIDRLNSADNEIILVEGPDDICAPRLCDKDDITCHCYEDSIRMMDIQALNDLKTVKGYEDIEIGQTLKLTENLIKNIRIQYKRNTIRTACIGCEWKNLCDSIADKNFKESKLK